MPMEETPSSYFARRFREFFLAYRQFGFGAFARKLNVQKEEFYYLDSSFVWMIFAKGLLFAAGLLFTLCAADRAVIGSGDAKLLVISFILQLYMVMERIPSYVIFILFLSAASLLVPYGKAPPRNGPAGSGGGDGK